MAEYENRPKQFNAQFTPDQQRRMAYLARITESIAMNGVTKGQPSIGALMRRIADGEVEVAIRGKIVKMPVAYTFSVSQKNLSVKNGN